MNVRLPALLAAAIALLTATGAAQRVVLPGATGGITPAPGWTVLRKAELDAATRPTDPASEPGRTLLMAAIAELRQNNLTDEQILLHQQGSAAGQLRLVQAYSAEGGATTDELLTESAIQNVRDVLEPALATGGTVAFVGSERLELLQPAAVRLAFTLDGGALQLQHDHVLIPAGERLQYFDCTFDRADVGAREALEALIGTFDGAREVGSRSRGLWIGGIAGALAGIVAALARSKRKARAIVGGGGTTGSGGGGAAG